MYWYSSSCFVRKNHDYYNYSFFRFSARCYAQLWHCNAPCGCVLGWMDGWLVGHAKRLDIKVASWSGISRSASVSATLCYNGIRNSTNGEWGSLIRNYMWHNCSSSECSYTMHFSTDFPYASIWWTHLQCADFANYDWPSCRFSSLFFPSLLLLVCVSFTIIGQPWNSVLIRRV